MSGMVELVEEVVKATFQIGKADVMEALFSTKEGQQYYLEAAMIQQRKGNVALEVLREQFYEMTETPLKDVSVDVNTSVEIADFVVHSRW